MSPEIKQEDWENLKIPKFPYKSTQLFFILRLSRLSGLLKSKNTGSTVFEDWQNKLLDQARYSTYIDCIRLDIKEQADEVLRSNEVSNQEQK